MAAHFRTSMFLERTEIARRCGTFPVCQNASPKIRQESVVSTQATTTYSHVHDTRAGMVRMASQRSRPGWSKSRGTTKCQGAKQFAARANASPKARNGKVSYKLSPITRLRQPITTHSWQGFERDATRMTNCTLTTPTKRRKDCSLP